MANPLGIGGGSRKGKPNKTSLARIGHIRAQGRRLPHEALLSIAERALETAARFQPGTAEKPNPEQDWAEFAHWLDQARNAYKDAAPYYAPRLMAVAVAAKVEVDGERVDPREVMLRTYLEMRRRGEIAQKTIEAPKAEPVELELELEAKAEPVPVPVKGNGADDGADGEAA